MELRDYLNVFSARRGIIILATIIVGLVSLAVSLIQSPVYQSEAKVLISEKDTGAAIFGVVVPELSSQPERAVQTQVQLIQVRPIAETVIRRLGLKETPAVLSQRLTVAAEGQTNVISIVAKAESPEGASAIANAVAEEYVVASRARKRASIKEAADEVEERLEQTREDILEVGRHIQDSGSSDELGAELQILTGTYSTLAEKLEQLRINERLESGSGAVVQNAVAIASPVEPRPLRNVGLGVAVGLIFGIVMAFLYEYLDNTIKSTDEAERIHGAPVLAIVPMEKLDRGQKRKLAIIDSPGSSAAEAYRVLRNSIDFVNFEHNLKTVLVTSAVPREGKSTVSGNLAASLAQAGKKVVLVSCDFRRPTTDQFFKVNNTIGLSDVLLGTHTLKAALQQPTSDQLLVLTAGKMPPNPSELLASSKMEEVIKGLEEWADWVIIDTPPILAVADPVSVARWSDGVLIVSRAGESTKEAALKAVEVLGKVGAKILGVAIWGLDESKNRTGYGYGYGLYTGGYYYYNSNYGYSSSDAKAPRSKAVAPGSPSEGAAAWDIEPLPSRKLAAIMGRILTALLAFCAVLALAITVVYFLDQYLHWGLSDLLAPYLWLS